jgi:hypothetical protein
LALSATARSIVVAHLMVEFMHFFVFLFGVLYVVVDHWVDGDQAGGVYQGEVTWQ